MFPFASSVTLTVPVTFFYSQCGACPGAICQGHTLTPIVTERCKSCGRKKGEHISDWCPVLGRYVP